jgi:hypothetical protein
MAQPNGFHAACDSASLHRAAWKPFDRALNNRAMNDRYFRTLMDAPDGKLEKQAKPGGLYIRRRMRERSIVRRLLEFETATESDLVVLPSEELPIMWGQLQNDSPGAVSMTFHDAVENETFWRDTFIVRFFVISTPEYYKNLWELKTHTHDTVKALTEDGLLDIEEEEDRRWFTASDDVVGPVNGVGDSGYIQNFYFGAFSRDHHVDSKYILADRQMPLGTFVVNQRFMANFEKMDRTEIGGDLSQDLFKQGGDALKDGKIGGVPHLFTSKNHIVPDDVVYHYTTPDYLGLAREYQKPTLYMRKEKRTIFFSIEEIIAITIANVGGVLKGIYQNDPA